MYALKEIRRLAVPIGVLLGVLFLTGFLSETSRLALLAYKLSVVSLATILAHMIRSEIFPYLDLKAALRCGDPGYAIGSSIVVGLLMFAIILAIAITGA